MTGKPRRWTDSWAAAALVAACAAAAFARALAGDFVFDDHRFIVANPHVQEPESWLRLLTDAGTADPAAPPGIVRPLRTLEFALDRAALGPGPLGFHVHSLLWHVLASVLLVLVLRRVLADGRAAFAAALVWAVHPVHAESVAWISSRGDVAAGACALLCLLFALRSDGFDRALAVSLAAAAVAMLFKESAVTLPLVVLALRWTKQARAPVWPYFALLGLYALYHASAHDEATGVGVPYALGGSVAGTFATMTRAFGFYVAQALVPANATDWYMTPSTSFADAAVIAWLAVHGALVLSAVLARAREPRWTLAVVWFYAFLPPVANWPFPLGIATAERFLYLPLAGVALAVGVGLTKTPRGAWTAALVAAAALGVQSVDRCGQWRDERTLWTRVLADHESPRAHERVGEWIQSDALAARRFLPADRTSPGYAAASARVREDLERALAHFHRAIDLWYAFEMRPASDAAFLVPAETNASNASYLLGRHDEALFHAEEALRIDPVGRPEAHYDRALPLLDLGFAPQALASLVRARELGLTAPVRDFADAADACERLGLLAAAEAGYAIAVELAPEQAALREKLASVGRRTAADGARENAKLTELDAALARLPRSCPVRRDHAAHR